MATLKNPNKYIRKAYLAALSAIGIDGWDKHVPANTEIPQTYYLITTQRKREILRSKCSKGWEVSTNIQLIHRENRGFSDSAILDDYEEKITDALAPSVQTDLAIEPFKVYNTFLDINPDFTQETPNESIINRVLVFRVILGEK